MFDVERPAKTWQAILYKSRIGLALLALAALLWLGNRARQKQTLPATALVSTLLLAACGLSFTLGQSNQPKRERAAAIIGDLLHNIYRAFDYREESDVYDVLDQSVAGELLTDIFLETKRSLVLANQGGARAKVKQVELEEVVLKPSHGDHQFSAEAIWVVNGAVGHWGHVHQRNNRYRAILTIAVVGQQWKLEKMKVLQEERL